MKSSFLALSSTQNSDSQTLSVFPSANCCSPDKHIFRDLIVDESIKRCFRRKWFGVWWHVWYWQPPWGWGMGIWCSGCQTGFCTQSPRTTTLASWADDYPAFWTPSFYGTVFQGPYLNNPIVKATVLLSVPNTHTTFLSPPFCQSLLFKYASLPHATKALFYSKIKVYSGSVMSDSANTNGL